MFAIPHSLIEPMGRRLGGVVFVIASFLIAAPASAQSIPNVPRSTNVSDLISKVFFPEELIVPDSPSIPRTPEAYAQQRQDSLDGIAIGIGTALASFPLGASSAGFTYIADAKTGDRVLKTASFGPLFVERAATNGRGVMNLGVNFQVSSFDRLQGVDLTDVGFPTYSQLGTYTDGSGVGDTFHARLDVNSRIFVFSGSYGVTDQFDIGWAVPIASIEAHAQFIRDYNGGKDWDNDWPNIRAFYPGKVGQQIWIDETINASGLGDIVVRGKYAFGAALRQRALVAAELRLPTGDEENLLGTGKTSLRLIAGGSAGTGVASLNVNGGYTVGGLTDEINFAAGTEVALLARKQLTMTFDVITQTLRDTVTSITEEVPFDMLFPDRRVIVSYRFWDRGSTTLARAAIGGKYAIANNWLLTGSVLFRLNDSGYQAKVVPFVGIERTISRK